MKTLTLIPLLTFRGENRDCVNKLDNTIKNSSKLVVEI